MGLPPEVTDSGCAGGIRGSLAAIWLRSSSGKATGKASGIIHSIDSHPSRKHICLERGGGGSLGTIFAWDRRWQKEPIFLPGVGAGGEVANSVCESEVWEIRCDLYLQSQGACNVSSSAILPVMSCSEDGILAVVKEGEEPVDLMAEPCAINSFDINSHNPSEVVCSLEWESIAIMSRPWPSFEIQSEPKTRSSI